MSIYEKILNEIKADYYIQNYANDGQRFIAWYLFNILKQDRNQTKDAITDGADDKQIDAIIIDDDGLAERLGHFRRNDPCHDIGPAARCVGHYPFDCSSRESVCYCGNGDGDGGQAAAGSRPNCHYCLR